MILPNIIISIPLVNLVLIFFCIFIATIGYFKKLVDFKSLLFICFFAVFFIYLFPLYWFVSLLILYITTSFATQYKREYKLVAHRKGRELKNLISNLLPSLLFSFVYLFFPSEIIYFAFLCGISCACADTLASEIGQLSKKNPKLITTFEEVKTGTEGGVSHLGLGIGLIGGLLVSLPALYISQTFFILAAIIGFIGCNIDSLIGAKYELEGKCSNETTNLIATTSSSILGIIVFLLLF
jgi:uncharacterized protein (TIGR00297 family)